MDKDELTGFYIVTVTWDDGKNNITVGIVYGESLLQVKEKALRLFEYTPFTSMEIAPLSLDVVKYTAIKGGQTVVHKEFYYD